ncbi:MAG: FtsQ-type POTRA domain-containing protein [Clostridia bacterium]|nr:FtsQ-type POTRA domain-containing protein [Clostridia bacterium]
MQKGKTLEELKIHKARRRARMRVFYIILALVLVFVGGYFLATRYFVIREITVSDSEYYTEYDIIKTTGLKIGNSLFTCNNSKIEQEICLRHPYISKAEIKKVFPTTISITVEEKDGAMYVPLLNDGYALNSEMKVLGKIKHSDNKIKVLTNGVKRCMVGEKVVFNQERDKKLAEEVYSALRSTGLDMNTSSIDVRDRFNITLNYDSRFDVEIGDEDGILHKIKILEKVVQDFPLDSGTITINNNGRAIIALDD